MLEYFMTFQSPLKTSTFGIVGITTSTQASPSHDKHLSSYCSLPSRCFPEYGLNQTSEVHRSTVMSLNQTSLNFKETTTSEHERQPTQQITKHHGFPCSISGCRVHSCSDWSITAVSNWPYQDPLLAFPTLQETLLWCLRVLQDLCLFLFGYLYKTYNLWRQQCKLHISNLYINLSINSLAQSHKFVSGQDARHMRLNDSR